MKLTLYTVVMTILLAVFAGKNADRQVVPLKTTTKAKATPKAPTGTKQYIDFNRLADAIYIAEGGARTSHPYGILTKYKKTTPRQACINTIKHAWNDWDGKGDFIVFLGGRYCPTEGENLTQDEKRLNKNWVKNVKYYYDRPRQ